MLLGCPQGVANVLLGCLQAIAKVLIVVLLYSCVMLLSLFSLTLSLSVQSSEGSEGEDQPDAPTGLEACIETSFFKWCCKYFAHPIIKVQVCGFMCTYVCMSLCAFIG